MRPLSRSDRLGLVKVPIYMETHPLGRICKTVCR
jgi:hypothetical protein